MGLKGGFLCGIVLCAGCPRVHVNIPPDECVGGSCTSACPDEDQVLCGDAGCVNLASDMEHCGACDAPCLPGHYCVLGTCTFGCSPPLLLCEPLSGPTCVDASADPDNCGGCAQDDGSHVCHATPAAGTKPVCNGGSCAWTCKPNLLDCGDAPAAASGEPTCLARDADNCNCGACGHACSSWSHTGSMCASTGPRTQACCGATCTALDSNGSCGSSCADVANCAADGRTCCPHSGDTFSCVNTQSDPSNCHACGALCYGAVPDCCADGCADLSSDSNNCGACGTRCTGTACCPTFGPDHGACTNLQADVHNCGYCGYDCAVECYSYTIYTCDFGTCNCVY